VASKMLLNTGSVERVATARPTMDSALSRLFKRQLVFIVFDSFLCLCSPDESTSGGLAFHGRYARDILWNVWNVWKRGVQTGNGRYNVLAQSSAGSKPTWIEEQRTLDEIRTD
jgi:hypothetical protein